MGLYPAPRLLPAGDAAVSVELGDDISREANSRALTLERLLLDAPLPGLVDTVPTFRSLLVHYDPLVLPWATLRARLLELVVRLADAPPPPSRRVELPCAYGGVHGPDLEEVARRLALTPADVVRLHAEAEHYVYFVGFTPGLPYMAGQPPELTIPRLDRPRTKTPAGSVGIGGTQTSIYSVESPGGFWLLGRTPVRLYDPAAADPILLRAGDHVRFRPIDAATFDAIAQEVAAGAYRPTVKEGV
jgi:inhibitor of KinA